jgi:hypothetical protein
MPHGRSWNSLPNMYGSVVRLLNSCVTIYGFFFLIELRTLITLFFWVECL